MEAKFKVGDVVRLKSGGPPMTVHRVGPSEGLADWVYLTYWCDQNHVFTGAEFSVEVLDGVS